MTSARKLAAILVADVVGYSRLAGADEERTLARLRGLRSDLIDPAIDAHRGRIVKRTGDGSLIEFRSVVDAVRCAIEVQQGLIERNAGLPSERRIEFRVGIHLGDVVEETDGDLMGDGVNIAARLESVAMPGAICLSEDAYRQVKGRLELAARDLGPTQLKNIAEPIRVYSLEVGKLAQAKPVPTAPAPQKADRPRLSIVVLPFFNIGGDPEQEYFVDGVTEGLTTDLSRMGGAFVIARNTAFTYKGKPIDVKTIGRELDVRYVLEGSVQRGGNRMRVNVQLIDAATGNHVWADRFDKPVSDIFDMQDEIVARLANTLGVELVKAEAKRSAHSNNPDAMDLAMRGWASIWQWERLRARDDLGAIRTLFERALAIDPNDPDALAGDARSYSLEWFSGWANPQTDYDAKILGQADRAIALAPDNMRAYMVKGYYFMLSRRPNEAIRTADAGLAINPNYAVLYAARAGAEISLRRFDQAKADLQQAMRLSPRDPSIGGWQVQLGDVEMGAGRTEAAMVEYQRALDAGDHAYYVYANLAAVYALAGRTDEAKAYAAETRRLNPSFTLKFVREHWFDIPPKEVGLRKAGFQEE